MTGHELRAKRLEHKQSQRDMAKELREYARDRIEPVLGARYRPTAAHVSRWETGQREIPAWVVLALT